MVSYPILFFSPVSLLNWKMLKVQEIFKSSLYYHFHLIFWCALKNSINIGNNIPEWYIVHMWYSRLVFIPYQIIFICDFKIFFTNCWLLSPYHCLWSLLSSFYKGYISCPNFFWPVFCYLTVTYNFCYFCSNTEESTT